MEKTITIQKKNYLIVKKWFNTLYGFNGAKDLKNFLHNKKIILDAGCGLGYKSAWFANLAPESIIIGIDASDAVLEAAQNYKHVSNLYFVKGDIAKTYLKKNIIDFVLCDQVIMHTQNPKKTFKELVRICNSFGEIGCYFYAKKAVPRELLDDHFRIECKKMSIEELWDMSEKLTILGKKLSDLKIKIDVPEIKALNIKGGKYDLQRFIYWNFIKCFWDDKLGSETSIATNFDWYSPSNAKRYSENEIINLLKENDLQKIYFNIEEACFSGRFN